MSAAVYLHLFVLTLNGTLLAVHKGEGEPDCVAHLRPTPLCSKGVGNIYPTKQLPGHAVLLLVMPGVDP